MSSLTILVDTVRHPAYRIDIIRHGEIKQKENEHDTIQSKLKELGFHTCAMALQDDSYSVDDPVLRQVEKLAVVLGTEGDGLAPTTVSGCDYTVKIPMYHGVDSLNVAAASAVAFWELRVR